MSAYDRILTALESAGLDVEETSPGNAKAQCPAHNDQTPSLSITRTAQQTLLYCHGLCETKEVLRELGLGMKDLFDNPRGATYRYDDGRVVKKSPMKKVTQSGNTKDRPTLYRAERVKEAAELGAGPVWLVEGEKDVEAIESRGAIATSAPMGAGNFGKVDVEPLEGAEVVAVVDKDDAGQKWKSAVRRSLAGVARSVRFVEAAVGKDAADHIAAGHDLDEFVSTVPPVGEILDRIEGFVRRFVAYPTEAAAVAHVLWIAHTHLMDRWDSTPRLAFMSPERGSGKTRALEVTEPLVPSPIHAVNVTPAYLFRKVQDGVTVLYDEIDTVFGPKAKDNEEVRGMLNAGHRRGAVAGRCAVSGKDVIPEELPAYCAVALAGLHDLPDTISSRAVVIRMQRRGTDETVEPWRMRVHTAEGNVLRDLLVDWAEGVPAVVDWPTPPEGVADRDADVWEALLVIAHLAGAEWVRRAEAAAVEIVAASKVAPPTLCNQLLVDLVEHVFEVDVTAEKPDWSGVLPTSSVLSGLWGLEESPWSDFGGRPISAYWLSQELRQYGIHSKDIKVNGRALKGYVVGEMRDAWRRYAGPRQEES